MFQAQDVVRVIQSTMGMPKGSQGVVVGRYANRPAEVLVRFWDGGPLTVPVEVLELVDRPAAPPNWWGLVQTQIAQEPPHP